MNKYTTEGWQVMECGRIVADCDCETAANDLCDLLNSGYMQESEINQ